MLGFLLVQHDDPKPLFGKCEGSRRKVGLQGAFVGIVVKYANIGFVQKVSHVGERMEPNGKSKHAAKLKMSFCKTK